MDYLFTFCLLTLRQPERDKAKVSTMKLEGECNLPSSPSPSQINNPAIYASAPPPLRHSTRPVSMAFPMPDTQAGSMSFYGSGAAMGYSAMPAPPPRPPQSQTSRPSLSAPQASGRPSSFYGTSSGKGPVSALLDLWSKH